MAEARFGAGSPSGAATEGRHFVHAVAAEGLGRTLVGSAGALVLEAVLARLRYMVGEGGPGS